MKILHVASHWGLYRGGAVQLSRIAIEQQRRGHHVTVVFSDKYLKNPYKRYKDISSWKSLETHGVRCRPLRYRGFIGYKRLLKFVIKEKFDLVHVHRNEALLNTTKALLGYDIPVIAQRGTISKPDKPSLMAGFQAKNVKAIVTVADAVKKSVIDTLGLEEKNNVYTIYGSVDIEFFSPRSPDLTIYRELKIPVNAKIIGSLSSYRKTKNIEHILYALKELLTEDSNIYGIFLGLDLHKSIIPLSKQLGIENHCRFLGHQSDITRYLSIMDVSVMTANGQEGLSGVIRESLAMEIPVISTDCAGNNEIIKHKETGLLIPVDDLDELIHAMRWSFENSEKVMQMAKNGRKWVLENCTPEVQVDRLDVIYKSATH
ncbi:MAG: glycosyltransferase family 4 protein [Bacteroidetes bacterium]|nr:glycosyltransferase family 4 protein [Bacteroidota bacterium]